MKETRFRYFKIAVFAVCCFWGLCIGASAQKVAPYKITGLKIVNYNQHNHSFKDVSDEKDLEYWNALGLSVIVSVEVSGKRNNYTPGRKVEVKVYEGRRLIQTHVGEIGYIDSGTFYVPTFLYGDFCRPLTIKARLTGQRLASSITKTLNFACGE